MKNKLSIAVSSCLLGNQVRYDGDTKSNTYILEDLSNLFVFKAICPEVGIGLSVPRPPMQLTRLNGEIQAVRIDEPEINYTQALKNYARQLIPQLNEVNAYIFKAKSPSCGVGTTILEHEKVNGIFAQVILKAFPELPVIDESQLENTEDRARFIKQVFRYAKK